MEGMGSPLSRAIQMQYQAMRTCWNHVKQERNLQCQLHKTLYAKTSRSNGRLCYEICWSAGMQQKASQTCSPDCGIRASICLPNHECLSKVLDALQATCVQNAYLTHGFCFMNAGFLLCGIVLGRGWTWRKCWWEGMRCRLHTAPLHCELFAHGYPRSLWLQCSYCSSNSNKVSAMQKVSSGANRIFVNCKRNQHRLVETDQLFETLLALPWQV